MTRFDIALGKMPPAINKGIAARARKILTCWEIKDAKDAADKRSGNINAHTVGFDWLTCDLCGREGQARTISGVKGPDHQQWWFCKEHYKYPDQIQAMIRVTEVA
jgi:hypothetical protein